MGITRCESRNNFRHWLPTIRPKANIKLRPSRIVTVVSSGSAGT